MLELLLVYDYLLLVYDMLKHWKSHFSFRKSESQLLNSASADLLIYAADLATNSLTVHHRTGGFGEVARVRTTVTELS